MKCVVFLIFSIATAARADLLDFYKARERGYNAWLLKQSVFERQRLIAAETSKERKLHAQKAYEQTRDKFKRRPWGTGEKEDAFLRQQALRAEKQQQRQEDFALKQRELNRLIEKTVIPMKFKEYQLEGNSNSGNSSP